MDTDVRSIHSQDGGDKIEEILLKNNCNWDNYYIQKEVAEEYRIWISEMAVWKVFLTLTFENETPVDRAMEKFKRLVRELNKSVFGKNYTRKVGHSYFSYILAIEKQGRGVIHFHVLIDRAVDFKLIHKWWGELHHQEMQEATIQQQ